VLPIASILQNKKKRRHLFNLKNRWGGRAAVHLMGKIMKFVALLK
jgi:hypothetical protein